MLDSSQTCPSLTSLRYAFKLCTKIKLFVNILTKLHNVCNFGSWPEYRIFENFKEILN